MKKIIITLLLIPIIFISCKLGVTGLDIPYQESSRSGEITGIDLNAGKAGDIVKNHIIVKTKKDFDGTIFKAEGFEIFGKLPINDEAYWYLFKNDTKLLKQALHIDGVLYAGYDKYVAAPEYTVTSPKHQDGECIEPLRGIQDGTPDHFDNGLGYGLKNTKALEAYKTYGYGTNTVYVGILDTGINMFHRDFKISDTENVVLYAKSCQKNGLFGSPYVGNNNPFAEIPIGENWDNESGHGTHCSGTICARGENASEDFNGGINGVAWKNTKLISYQVLGAAGGGQQWAIYGSMLDLVNTIRILRKTPQERTEEDKRTLPSYLKDTQIQITQKTVPVNMSLGGSTEDPFAHHVLNYALENDILPVIAMGNEGTHTNSYPAALPGMLSVGALDGRDKHASFSTRGPWINISAPGVAIESCRNEGAKGTVQMSGTSMATPFITGTIAYLLSFDEAKSLSPYQFKRLLEETADKVDSSLYPYNLENNKKNETYGYGRVNVLEAVKKLKAHQVPSDDFYCSTAKVTVEVTNKNKPIALDTILVFDTTANIPIADIGNLEGKPFELRGLVKDHQYEVSASFGNTTQKKNFTASASNQTVKLEFNTDVVWISTVPNLAYNGGKDKTDTQFTVYKAGADGKIDTAAPVLSYDYELLDTAHFFPEAGVSSYYVCVAGYVDDNNVFQGGNYIIKIGDEPLHTSLDQTDGGRKADENDSHEPDDYPHLARSNGNAWNQTYACNLVSPGKDNSGNPIPDTDIFVITINGVPGEQLPKPDTPTLTATPQGLKAAWTKVNDIAVKFYIVRYYCGDTLVKYAEVDADKQEWISENLDNTKEYTVTVQALSDLKQKKDSEESEKSNKVKPLSN